MWTVVLFDVDNTLAAVPAFWFQNGNCWWPTNNVVKHIQKRTRPNELEFSSFKAKMMFEHIGLYYIL